MEATNLYNRTFLVAIGLMVALVSCNGETKPTNIIPSIESFEVKTAKTDGFGSVEDAKNYLDSLLQNAFYFEREIKKYLLNNPGGTVEDGEHLEFVVAELLVSVRTQQQTILALLQYYQNQVQHDLTEWIDSLEDGFTIGSVESFGDPFFSAHYYGDLELDDRSVQILFGALTIHGNLLNHGVIINDPEQYDSLITLNSVNSELIIIQ